jgi:outer membrane protein
VTIGVAKNNLLPEFDFITSVGPQGINSNYGDAARDMFKFAWGDFTVGFKLQIPLGNRAARSIYRRSMLQHMQAIEQYRSFIEQVTVDVKTSSRAVDTAWEALRSERRSRFAAEDALDRINKRQASGEPLTPEFVQLKLQIQDALAQALQSESEGVANYNIALSQLEKSKGTILRYDNVVLQEDPLKTQGGSLAQ